MLVGTHWYSRKKRVPMMVLSDLHHWGVPSHDGIAYTHEKLVLIIVLSIIGEYHINMVLS